MAVQEKVAWLHATSSCIALRHNTALPMAAAANGCPDQGGGKLSVGARCKSVFDWRLLLHKRAGPVSPALGTDRQLASPLGPDSRSLMRPWAVLCCGAELCRKRLGAATQPFLAQPLLVESTCNLSMFLLQDILQLEQKGGRKIPEENEAQRHCSEFFL